MAPPRLLLSGVTGSADAASTIGIAPMTAGAHIFLIFPFQALQCRLLPVFSTHTPTSIRTKHALASRRTARTREPPCRYCVPTAVFTGTASLAADGALPTADPAAALEVRSS